MKDYFRGGLYPKAIGHLVVQVVIIIKAFGVRRRKVSRRVADALYDRGVLAEVDHFNTVGKYPVGLLMACTTVESLRRLTISMR